MPQSSPTTKRSCVVADDVKANRTLVATWFEELEFECYKAADGAEAWKLVNNKSADLIVTDIDMPGCSGLELLHSLRSHASERLRGLPVIVMSSLRDSGIDPLIRAYGGTAFLPKPLEKEKFRRVVAAILGARDGVNYAAEMMRTDDGEGMQHISPTLRRLVREAQSNPPRFC